MGSARNEIFGFRVTPLSLDGIVARLTEAPRPISAGVGLVSTPNIDSIALIRRNRALAEVYRERTELITCDGFPVFYYARARGLDVPARVPGTDITERLMRHAEIAPWQRLFFAVDGEATRQGLEAWAARRDLSSQIRIAVCPPDFAENEPFMAALAGEVAAFGTTILLMGIGAPKSELFVDRYRSVLPPCWALCVGSSVKIEAGTATRAPVSWQKYNLEWFYRLLREPRRLGRRYVFASIGFLAAVFADLAPPGASR